VDARLPGGSMPWQVGSACVAGLSAGCGWRAVAGLRSLSARTVRLVAVVSWVASATWGLALGLLWLLWPR
jgi:hypothetical protein